MRYRNDSRNIAVLKDSEKNTSKNCVRPVIEIPMSQMETTTVHLITLNPNGGNFSGSTDNKLKTVLDTQKVGELPTPTRSAYQFGGWYTGVNSGVLVDENYVVNDETTLFARWIKNPAYVITFETNGGDPIDSIEVDQGEQIGELPIAERDGYLFEGWYLESEL